MANSKVETHFAAVFCVVIAFNGAGCKKAPQNTDLKSGGGTNPVELGCRGLQESFVDNGLKFEERIIDFKNQYAENEKLNAANSLSTPASATGTNAEPGTNQQANPLSRVQPKGFDLADPLTEYLGVKKNVPFKGNLGALFAGRTSPLGIRAESECVKFSGKSPTGLYDTCVEMVQYQRAVNKTAYVWDNDTNKKRCFEGKSFNETINPEFGYCDNECGFNEEYCYDCTVKINNGAGSQRFVCKSQKTATDAIGGFCRNTGVRCDNYLPEQICKRVRGTDIAGGTTTSQGGKSEETTSVKLSGYLGASESVSVSAGLAGGQSLSARGTVTGTIGLKRIQGVGAMWTPSRPGVNGQMIPGLGVNGLEVQCILSVTGVGEIKYDHKIGFGGDFVFAKGEATVDAGGSFSLTDEYTKLSPTFSGAGQTFDGLLRQCTNNYLAGWIGIELDNWVQKYSGLRVIKKAISKLASEIGLDRPEYRLNSSNVYCVYPNYDSKAWRTAEVILYNRGDHFEVQWSHYLSGWPDKWSEKLAVNDDAISSYLRAIKDSSLAGSKMKDFFQSVVVPASKNDSRAAWHISNCQE